MNMTLQYRIGTSGTFTTVAGATYTTSNNSQAAATNFTNISLPVVCENKPVVQLRWITYESASQSGSRDAIRLDDITVTSSVGPVITGAATASPFSTTYGTPSAIQTFPVSGTGLTADLLATAPTGFEVASDGATFGPTATFTQSGGNASGTLSVRLKATAAVLGNYNSQNIVLSTTGATPVNIVTAASGNAVTAKALSITASAQTKTYGLELALGTSLFSSSGLENSETIGAVTLTSSGSAAAAPATTYAITPSAATGGTFTASNYNITYNTGTLTVDPKALTITANAVTKAFGNTLASPVTGSTAFTSIGLVGSETIGSVTISYGTGAASGDAAGTYPNQVTPSLATGGTFSISNYTPTYVSSTLTVTADPTISVTGTLAAVDTTYGTPSATPSSFSVSGLALTGNLTVTPPAGFEVSPSIGAGYTNSLVLMPDSGILSATTVYVRLAGSTAFGSYSGDITVSGGGATSQTIATAPSSVAKKALTIAGLTGVNKPYDGTLAATTTGTPAYVGLENGESFAVTGTASAEFASTGAGTAKPVTVTGYTAPSDNYSVTQPTGLSADITPVPLSITAPTIADKPYNGSPTAGAVTVGTLSGFVGSETVTATASAAAYPSANAATYTGTVITYALQNGTNGGLASNYTLPNGTADGTIIPKSITVTANSVSKEFGETLTGGPGSTAFTTGTGLVTPDTIGSVTITYGAGAAAGDAAGTYLGAVTPSAATGGTFTATNYSISYVAGNITVMPPLIAGWDFQTTTTGGTAAAAAPGSPTTYTANLGEGTIYMNGTNGASTWTSLASNSQVTSFTGTAVNAAAGFSIVTTATSCLAIANSSANNQRIVFKFSMSGRADLMVSYATRRTNTGFNSHLWEYSTNGTTWTTAGTIGSIPTADFESKSLATITALDRAPIAYLRLTVSGASTATGNNRLDNIQIRAANAPAIEFTGTVAAFTTTFGSPSAEQIFAISGLNLSADITATAPTGFEVSSDGTTYASTATFTESGGEASGSLRIRLTASAPVSGSYNSQNIVLSSTGAPSVNITTTASGNIVSKATPVITTAPTASAITEGQTLASSTLSGGVASVPGTFAFTTPATTPPVGTDSQGVTFTPTDTSNYNNATTTVSVTVNPGSTLDPLFTDPTMNAVLSTPSAGVRRLNFTGIPARVYGIQRSGTLAPGGWTQIGIVTAPTGGACEYDDPSPLPERGFYRIIYPAVP
ncbi:MAG: beta strand repeat-containing protein [Verrucomicrobiales bacterium]